MYTSLYVRCGNSIQNLENEDGEVITKDGEQFVHKPAESLSEKRKTEKLREKLKEKKERRKLEAKLRSQKTLADSDSDEDTAAWVTKSRQKQKEKEMAEKRARLLEEMEEEFGLSGMVEEEFGMKKKAADYSSRDLRGMTVQHSLERFKEGQDVILTLKDREVLNEDEDVLLNVNMVDSERYKRNIENKKMKPDYNPFDEPEIDEFGELKKKNILSKYDEEIDGEVNDSFKIGELSAREKEQKNQEIRRKLNKKLQSMESLEMPAPQLANEYYTESELSKFKKVKKKKKKKLLKADDLLDDIVPDEDVPSQRRDGTRRKTAENTRMEVDDDDIYATVEPDEADLDLQSALSKARKLRQQEQVKSGVEKVVEGIVQTEEEHPSQDLTSVFGSGSILLNATEEFCRTLGDIPTYGQAGNREEDDTDMVELEQELAEEKRQEEEEEGHGAWSEVKVIDTTPVEIQRDEKEKLSILDAEPDIGAGIAGALNLAIKKGYMEQETNKRRPTSGHLKSLEAQNYSIEDKVWMDDEKRGRRERYIGSGSEFKEKANYRPDVKLDYVGDDGRLMNQKEAFRYLSHKFHGKTSGKLKTEKRMKKIQQDSMVKQMSSTDTPLNTVEKMIDKQKELQSPFIMLSGTSKQQQVNPNLMSKQKK